MSEPDNLPTANRLRFSLALGSVMVIGLTVISVQWMQQLKVDEEAKAEADDYQRVVFKRRAPSPTIESETQATAIPPTVSPKKTATRLAAVVSRSVAPSNDIPTVTVSDPVPSSSEAPQLPSAVTGVPRGPRTPGTIFGTVFLKGTPPPEKEIVPLNSDPTCGRLHKEPIKTRSYLIGTNNGLANAFVYIKEGLPAGRKYQSTNEFVLNQVGCLYEPYVSGVLVNQKFRIRNSDPVLHNVHTTFNGANMEINFGQPVQGQVTTRSFSKPEIMLRFKCDVHPWMFAYVGVVAHPYFAVTDADGHFEIKNLAAGFYRLEAVHPKAGVISTLINVTADSALEDVVVTLQVPNQP